MKKGIGSIAICVRIAIEGALSYFTSYRKGARSMDSIVGSWLRRTSRIFAYLAFRLFDSLVRIIRKLFRGTMSGLRLLLFLRLSTMFKSFLSKVDLKISLNFLDGARCRKTSTGLFAFLRCEFFIGYRCYFPPFLGGCQVLRSAPDGYKWAQ